MFNRLTYPLIIAFLCGMVGLSGQSTPYINKLLLKNSSQSTLFYPCYGPELIDSSAHGEVRLTIDTTQNYRYNLQYTPAPDFVGSDTVSVEYLDFLPPTGKTKFKHFIFKVLPSFLEVNNDYYKIYKNQQNVEVSPLSNDSTSIVGSLPIKIVNISAANFVTSIVVQDTSLRFTPFTDFTGLAKINFTVCDTNSQCQEATAIISVIDTLNMLSDSVWVGTPEDVNVVIPLPQENYVEEQLPNHGTISVSQNSVLYDPTSNFSGKDTFILRLNSLYKTVYVEVYAQDEPLQFIINDKVITSKDSTVYFNVRDNDVVKKYAILLHAGPTLGTLTKLNNNGDFKYIPKPGYEGVQTFTYKACPQGICEYGKVNIYIGNFEPEKKKTYTFRSPKNVPLLLSYEIPLDAYSFSATIDSVKFYPGQQSITKVAPNGCSYTFSGYNMIIYHPYANDITKRNFDVTYCVTSTNQCHTVKCEVEVFNESSNCAKQCAGDCVWPGDVNLDGEVNMKDLLQVGHHLGYKGPTRAYGATEHRALRADNWDMYFPNSAVDIKNADTDGNGVIDCADTLSISNFYHKQHSLKPKLVYERGTFPFELNILTPDVDSGDLALIEVQLGDSINPVIDLAGYTYELDYNKDIVIESTLDVDFYYQGWASANNAIMHMHKKPWDGRLESGFVRSNAMKVSGKGGVELITCIVEDDLDGWRGEDEKVQIPFFFSGIKAMNQYGEIVELEEKVVYITLHRKKANTKPVLDPDKLLVFPNPSNTHITLHLNGANIMKDAHLLSFTGSVINEYKNINPRQNQFDVSDIHAGIYLLKVNTALGPITKKIEIIR